MKNSIILLQYTYFSNNLKIQKNILMSVVRGILIVLDLDELRKIFRKGTELCECLGFLDGIEDSLFVCL
jgi:hypothetical protein